MLNVTMSPHSDWSLRKVGISDCSLGTVGISKVLGALFSSEGAKNMLANKPKEKKHIYLVWRTNDKQRGDYF